MKYQLATMLGALVLVGATVGSSSASGAQHEFYPENYDAYEHFDAGQGFCVTWAGTFHEVRHGGYRLVAAPGGQQPGELHVNGVIEGSVELIPDDAGLPTYSGIYREKVNGVLTAITDEGDVERVSQYRLRSTLQGTDGSTLDLRLSGKLTMNANGVVDVSRDTFTCEQAPHSTLIRCRRRGRRPNPAGRCTWRMPGQAGHPPPPCSPTERA